LPFDETKVILPWFVNGALFMKDPPCAVLPEAVLVTAGAGSFGGLILSGSMATISVYRPQSSNKSRYQEEHKSCLAIPKDRMDDIK
jgi:hypothetical protein